MAGADPASVVADADVLAADLLVGGEARATLDLVRSHSWIDLVASDPLLDDAQAVIVDLSDPDLARDWRGRVEQRRIRVTHPPGDHPGLASAYRGRAAHLVSFDETLGSARMGLSIQPHAGLSVRTPRAFVSVFDAEGLYLAARGEDYPGPDRDPRA